MQKTIEELLQLLNGYNPATPVDARSKQMTMSFLASNDIVLGSGNPRGHLTGSVWIINTERTKVLLTHHRLLGKWLQLGGHTDEGEDIVSAALREAREESGLEDLRLLSEQIFDIDVHTIPESMGKPEHLHYDIRFLAEGDDNKSLIISHESRALKWVRLSDIKEYSTEESILRMARKTIV
ncbi:MAG: NUDIX hydrolase [Firmicutes bacterium]|nr:NUDIX hydrolase [Bacillota bacterium]